MTINAKGLENMLLLRAQGERKAGLVNNQTEFEILALSALILGDTGFFHGDRALLETLDILHSGARRF